MKRIFKYLTLTSLSGLLCLFLAFPANAQRGGGHGGGGGFHGGGGGGFHGSSGGGGFRGSSGGGFHGSSSFRGGSGFSGHANVGAQRSGAARSYSGRSYSVSPGARSYTGRVGARGYVGRGSVGARSYSGRAGIGARGYVGRGGVGARGYAGVTRIGGRGYIGGRYRGYGPWRGHGGFYYNRGLYGSLYYPRLGFSIGYLPYGYYPFYWDDMPYYYSNGYYYNYDDGQYTVVEPPVGAAINALPDDAQPITINGQQYYESNGVYYLPITKDDGTVVYQVAGKDGQLDTGDTGQDDQGNVAAPQLPQMGDILQQLPEDCRRVKVNGQTLYVSPDDVYFKQTTDNGGNKAYKVVGVPSDDQQ